ncbi:MAG: RecQ family ATP-dependent DNA helicase [Odoribacteraceae bacterium]|jgi:ATP-dependent DNA helicase RecQ|nr:RecQ family ATP-dependent DNA helicase [Odoribacteraceae bacterium]
MIMDPKTILKQYWGYDAFRPLQEEIIRSVLEREDTLALMPTGGGKSLTYQVPGLILDGTCLVVTPLIALMKDQVEGLKQRGILAEAIYTGMTPDHVSTIINKCIYHRVHFLYVSPERLASEHFRGYLRQMPVSMIAVDEAHCISQWGYDFRPSYLRVAEARALFPSVPVLALTATATPEVVEDIQARLKFRKPCVFSTSFRRDNLVYVTREIDDKMAGTRDILLKVPGSAIVYVRSRRRTAEVSDFLNESGVLADFYHAGLSSSQREKKQEEWKEGKTTVIVATNAFGMGIDKADVRVVIHYDIPDSPEAYFQEAGRGGRDGQRAYAVLIYNSVSLATLKSRVSRNFPKKRFIRQVYEDLASFLNIPEGGGEGMSFEFDLERFLVLFRLERSITLSAIEVLSVAGYLELISSRNSLSRVTIIVPRDQLYEVDLKDPLLERLLVFLMRSCAGIFVQEAFVDEEFIAGELHVNPRTLYKAFVALARERIIRYVPANDSLHIFYLMPRFPASYLTFGYDAYEKRKRAFKQRVNTMVDYVEERDKCRQLFLMEYFGKGERERCGVCDTCIKEKKRLTRDERGFVDAEILRLLAPDGMELEELTRAIDFPVDLVIDRVRALLDVRKIELNFTYLRVRDARRKKSKPRGDSEG